MWRTRKVFPRKRCLNKYGNKEQDLPNWVGDEGGLSVPGRVHHHMCKGPVAFWENEAMPFWLEGEDRRTIAQEEIGRTRPSKGHSKNSVLFCFVLFSL